MDHRDLFNCNVSDVPVSVDLTVPTQRSVNGYNMNWCANKYQFLFFLIACNNDVHVSNMG